MKTPLIRSLTAILALALAGCGDSTDDAGPGTARDGSSSDRPNVLLVTLDTLRADRVGAYGYDAARTPNIDAVAARGVLFEQAYTPAPMTLPAHATLLTGLLPPEHGARVNGAHKLADDVPTLATQLSDAGYRTGAFVAAFVLDGRFGLARGFDEYDDDLSGAYGEAGAKGLATYRPGNLVVDAALEWLADGDGTEPFFAWVHMYDAHLPWHPHGPDAGDPNADGNPNAPMGSYDGEVAFTDEQLGRLLDFLHAHGIEERTLITVVADHGEGLGDHQETGHAYLLNEEVLRVPWVMAGPGVSPGHRVTSLVSLEDHHPTLLDLLGLLADEPRGRSLVAALQAETIPSGASYAETDLPWTSFRWAPQRSLTTEDWKYIRTPKTELYDRGADRAERANLAADRAAVLTDMERRLQALERTFETRTSDVADVTSEELEMLAALGYVGGVDDDAPADGTGLADMKDRLHVLRLSGELRHRISQATLGPEEHLAMARQLVEASPETPSFQSGLGEALAAVGNLPDALACFEQAVELAPTNARMHYAYGDTLVTLGRYEEARGHLEMAIKLEPKMATAHLDMGNVWRAEGRLDLAADAYREALRLRPRYPEARYNLAMTLLDQDLPLEAIESLQKALEQRPGWGYAQRQLAILLPAQGRLPDAVPHFEGALAAFPGDVGLRIDFGVTLRRLGQPAEAREQFAMAAEQQPGSFRPVVNLGHLAFGEGEDTLALEHYEEALRLAPGLAEPNAQLARFLATTPDPVLRDGERAVALAERAADLSGGQPRVLDTLAAAYAAAGRFPEAVSTAHQAQQRAQTAGDEVLVTELEQRIAQYTSGEAYVLTRGSVTAAPEEGVERTEASGEGG